MNVQWTNLGINAVTWVCCGLAMWGIMVIFKGKARLWATGLYLLVLVGAMAGLIWPIVKM